MNFSTTFKQTAFSAATILALLFASDPSAHASISVSPTAVNCGTQVVGTTSAPVAVTLTNSSKGSIKIQNASVSTAQFSYSGPAFPMTLAPGQKLTASVKFTPAAAQSYAGTLVFTRSNGATSKIALSGSGTPASAGYTLSATPSAFSFSAQSGGTVTMQSVTIDDTTPGPLPFTLSADQSWIVLSAKSGTTKAVMQLGVNPAGLTAGNYSGHVFVSASGVVNSPLNVPVTLTVSGSTAVAPTITTQPLSQTVIAGHTVTFTVAANGTAPMTYQWKKTGAVISGATSSTYTTPATSSSDNGAQFTVTVSNSTGNATSAAAVLTVNAASILLNSSATSLNFGNVSVSTSSSQNAQLTNAGNSNVSISNVSISGAGFSVTGLSTGLILNPGQAVTLTAAFAPATTGSASGSITVTSNASNSPDTIVLSGAGMAPVTHSVSLSWTPSTSSVIGYNSYSDTISGGPYLKLTSNPVPTASYTDTTVLAGQTYYYVVTAVDSNNVESLYSNEVSAIVP